MLDEPSSSPTITNDELVPENNTDAFSNFTFPREEEEFIIGMRDSRITFDEPTHVYFVDGIPIKRSVTQFIHSYFGKFDADNICRLMIRSKNFMTKSEHEKYKSLPIWYDDCNQSEGEWSENRKLIDDKHKVVQIITDSWKQSGKDAAESGTKLHYNIEQFMLDVPVLDDSIEFGYFLLYNEKMRKSGFIPYRMEMRVFDESISLAGSIDMIWVHTANKDSIPIKVSLVDWKMSKQIRMNGYGYGNGCCSDIPDCNYYQYSLQLNTYKYMLEKYYNMIVEDMTLVILHRSNPSYIEIPIDDMQPKVLEMMNDSS